jgi:hydroxypyruvate isomerase
MCAKNKNPQRPVNLQVTDSQRPIIISVIQYMSQVESGEMSTLDLVNKASELGVDGVELRREPWPAYKTELPDVRAQLEKLGLLVTYGSFSTLFNNDAAAHKQLLDDITTAHALGSPLLRVFPGATPADDASTEWTRAQEAIDLAAELGIQIALENFARTPGGTLAEVANILGRIDSPALKTNIDIGNYPLHNENVLEAIQTVGDRAIYVHVKDYSGSPDNPVAPLGEGVLPLGQIFAALDALPQRIILCFEFGGGDEPDERIQDALSYLGQYSGEHRGQ